MSFCFLSVNRGSAISNRAALQYIVLTALANVILPLLFY
jgi:hypothetical protein